MFDRYHRRIDYLRVSVTDRCNLRCTYCMPPEGVPLQAHDSILSYEEIVDVCRAAIELGVRKIRITGGEPLVRRNVVDVVQQIASLEGLEDLALTTNGTYLAAFAAPLRKAGLMRVNISLDSLDPDRFRSITRCGELRETLDGIDAARHAGFRQIKLNCVVCASSDEPDARAVAAFGRQRGIEVRFIRQMDLARGEFWPVLGGSGGRCECCNRLRLSCRGSIYPCLFSDLSFEVRALGARQALLAAVAHKPLSGRTSKRRFYTLGG